MTRRPWLAEQPDLRQHPEGGWFRETWRSAVSFSPAGYSGERSAATAIYFLLCPGEDAAWHIVRSESDELWRWHSGGHLHCTRADRRPSPSRPASCCWAPG